MARSPGARRLSSGARSVLFDHCVEIYKYMADESIPESYKTAEGKTEVILVWTGHPTGLVVTKLGKPSSYYTPIMSALKAMDCVEQLSRGGGSNPSRWRIKREPRVEVFNTLARSTNHSKSLATINEQRLRDLQFRIERMENILQQFVDQGG